MSGSSPACRAVCEPQPPFRIVLRHRGDHEQLDVRDRFLDEAVGVDDAQRILPRIEATDLADHRAVRIERETGHDLPPLLLPYLSILWAQGIDRRGGHDPMAEPDIAGRVTLRAENRGIVRLQIGPQEGQNGGVRAREVDVTPPDPRRSVFDKRHEGRGLRVVDHDDVKVILEIRRIRLVHLSIGRLHCGRQAGLRALEGIVNRLGRVEEWVGAGHDEPVRIDAQVPHQRDQAVQQFRDPSTVGGRVHVRDPLALELSTESLEFLRDRGPDNRPVVLEPLWGNLHLFHRSTAGRRISHPLFLLCASTACAFRVPPTPLQRPLPAAARRLCPLEPNFDPISIRI